MAAAATDNFMEVGDPGSATNLAGSGYTIGATSITVTTTTNWPTNTGVIFGIDTIETDAEGNEVRVDGSYCIFQGVVTSATTIGSVSKLFGDDQDYAAGASTRVYITVSTEHTNRMIQALLQEHNQDGTHSDITADSATITDLTVTNFTIDGTAGADGWSPLGQSVNTVTANGNRSYTLVVNGADTTGTTSVGQKLKLARTVTAPTQCADLEASSSQYFNDTTVSGMTFTDDFVVSAWVKLESYPSGSSMVLVSRYNGTSGWDVSIDSQGRLVSYGYNGGASNLSGHFSYQSVPLNKWVHIAVQVDMSSFTSTTTTNYVMFDGVDVPTQSFRSGTNPTALVQAGNLEIGSRNGGLLPFDGKIAQVAIYSAKVTQATIRASMNQTLTGSETSLVSAYTLSNSLNDLSANANNLTAQNSAVTTNTDTPFTNSVTGTNVTAGTTNYGIIMSQTFSTNTTYVVQVPEGETLPTSGGVGTVSYSTQKTPYGFPGQRSKWTIKSLYLQALEQTSAANGTWYNPNSKLVIPIGEWETSAQASPYVANSTNNPSIFMALSTTNNSYTDREMMTYAIFNSTANHSDASSSSLSGEASLTAETTYYLNVMTDQAGSPTLRLNTSSAPVVIKAVNAYI